MNEMHRGEEEAVEEIITISFLLMFLFFSKIE